MSKQLEPLLTRTQFAFPDTDWGKLLKLYGKCKNDDEKADFMIKNLKGLPVTSYSIEQIFKEGDTADIQRKILTAFNHPLNVDVPGVVVGLSGTTSTFAPLDIMFWGNHPSLTPDDVRECRTVEAHGGGTYLYVIMPQPTRKKGWQGLHVEPVFVFDDPRDGEPLTFSVGLRYAAGQPAYKYIMDRYPNLSSLGETVENSTFSKLMTPPQDSISAGAKNIALMLRYKDWHLAIVDKLDYQKQGLQTATPDAPYGDWNSFPAIGFVAIKCGRDTASKWLQLEALHKKAVGDDEGKGKAPAGAQGKAPDKPKVPLSLSTHSAPNSCGATGAAIYAETHDGEAFGLTMPQDRPLRQLVTKAFEEKGEIYWARKSASPHLKDVVPDHRDTHFERISPNEAGKRVKKILDDPEMLKNTITGHPSWENSYNTFLKPHPDQTAKFFEMESLILVNRSLDQIPTTSL